MPPIGFTLTPDPLMVHPPAMAHKTISLDSEAYAALARKKRQDQTYS